MLPSLYDLYNKLYSDFKKKKVKDIPEYIYKPLEDLVIVPLLETVTSEFVEIQLKIKELENKIKDKL